MKQRAYSVYVALTFIAVLALAYSLGHAHIGLVLLYVLLSFVTYLLYVVDKYKAKRNKWRISERTLHLFSLFGGWPGAAIAQHLHRHKTQKRQFRQVYWITLFLNMAVLLWVVKSNVLHEYGITRLFA